MAEIRAVPDNGLVVASTFSGAGGSSLGYRMAGFRVAWASEFVEAARATYAANFPTTKVDPRDVRQVQPEEILEAVGLRAGELDVLDGSPPCASFSLAGNREKGWGQVKPYSDTKQRTDDLFDEYCRLVEGLRPRTFVAENVRGLTVGAAARGYLRTVLRRLEAAGYEVEGRVLDAQWLGVPQRRQRLIIVGVRRDIADAGLPPAHPEPRAPRYTLRDALPWLDGVIHDTKGIFDSDGDVTDLPAPTITVGANSFNSAHFRVQQAGFVTSAPAHGPNSHGQRPMHADDPAPSLGAPEGGGRWYDARIAAPTPEELEGTSLAGFAIAEEASRLAEGAGSDRYLNLQRAAKDEPCPTVTQTAGSSPGTAGVVHPDGTRKFTIRELRRVFSFPDDFELTGNYRQQWERLGRAVPPLMMRAVAEVLRDRVLLPARSRGLI